MPRTDTANMQDAAKDDAAHRTLAQHKSAESAGATADKDTGPAAGSPGRSPASYTPSTAHGTQRSSVSRPSTLSDFSAPNLRPVLGTSGLHPSVIANGNASSTKIDALRQIVSRLLLARRGEKLQPLAVCSVERGDGRSFVAANLAILFAQAGKRTLLIDADFRHADQHQLFDIDAGPGLADLLMGNADWGVIKPIAQVPNLFLLPFGHHHGDPLELIASDQFSEVFGKLADICDVVLVDTPAGDHNVDAQAIAAQVGSALLVVKQGSTSLRAARDFAEALGKVGAHILGAVINFT